MPGCRQPVIREQYVTGPGAASNMSGLACAVLAMNRLLPASSAFSQVAASLENAVRICSGGAGCLFDHEFQGVEVRLRAGGSLRLHRCEQFPQVRDRLPDVIARAGGCRAASCRIGSRPAT